MAVGLRTRTIARVAALAVAFVMLALFHRPAHAQEGATVWLSAVQQAGATVEIASPDGAIRLRLYLTNARDFTGAPRFDVTYQQGGAASPVVTGGRLGIDLKNVVETAQGEDVVATLVGSSTNWRWQAVSLRSVRTQFTMEIGERTTIPDAYSEVTVELTSIGAPAPVTLQVIARAYNEGIALRYRLPDQPGIETARIDTEYTTFAFSKDHMVWAQSAQEVFANTPPHENEHEFTSINAAPSPLENPLTLQHKDGGYYMALTEAAVEYYPSARFVRSATTPPSLRVDLRGSARNALPFVSPWRVLMIAPTAAALAEQNYLMYNLAPASRIADTSWIKPGKAIRIGNVVDEEYAKTVIDFAVDRGVDYVLFDAGWYGDENSSSLSPLSPAMSYDALVAVVGYAKERDIGIVLYVNYIHSRREIDQIVTQFGERNLGIAGIKLGFVDGLTQEGIKEILYTVQQAAQYKMFVDVHDNYCPSGMNRTWPNLLTQECVRGNEHVPGAEHNTTLPFTRLLLGPADYTIRWKNLLGNTTRAHQMALSIIYFSPFQLLFWGDGPAEYNKEPEAELFRHLPTRWDETRVLDDEIGDSVAIARRSDTEWFVGAITDGTARTVELSLDFLAEGVDYTAYIYSDGGGTTVHESVLGVTSADIQTFDLPAGGGAALRIVPAE